MELRKTTISDIDIVINIFEDAKKFMREQGIDQWNNNYPNPEVIKNDIENGIGYVLEDDDRVIGTAAVIFDGEKDYDKIYEGKWISEGEYTTIHRVAVDSNIRGLGIASIILNKVEELSLSRGLNSIRIDTHRDNLPMQKLLAKNGFIRCGIIYLEDESERIAFEKILK